MTYSSGLAAAFSVWNLLAPIFEKRDVDAGSWQALTLLNPQRIAITEGYMGVIEAVDQFRRIRNGNLGVIGIDDEFQDGDLCWLETPVNPTGVSRNIQHYADKVSFRHWS